MAREKRVFLRMNSDDSPLALPNGDVLRMSDVHVFPTHVTNVKGTVLIPEGPAPAPPATAWRVKSSSFYCEKEFGDNNGIGGYALLEQYYLLSGALTGQTKPNEPGDADYVAPSMNLARCPLPETTQRTLSIGAEIFTPTRIRATISRSDSAEAITVYWAYRYTDSEANETQYALAPAVSFAAGVNTRVATVDLENQLGNNTLETIQVIITAPIPAGYTVV